MMWIIFSILFVIVFGMFIFFKHSQQINYKLFQKQKYYHIKNQIANPYKLRSGFTFTLSVILLLLTVVTMTVPRTNGALKVVEKSENFKYLVNNYFSTETKTKYEAVKHTATHLDKPLPPYRINKELENIAFIDNNKLVLKALNGHNKEYQYESLPEDAGVLIFKQHILVYYNIDESSSVINIHDFKELKIVETITMMGKIEIIDVRGEKVRIALNTQNLEAEDDFVHFHKRDVSLSIPLDRAYYFPNNTFYQRLILMQLDSYLGCDLYSLLVNDYYLLVRNNTVYIATNINDNNNYYSSIIRYDLNLGLASIKYDLVGMVYKSAYLDKGRIVVDTVEEIDNMYVYRNYKFTTLLLKVDEDTFELGGESSDILMKIDDEYGYASINEDKITIETQNDKIEYSFDTTVIQYVSNNLYIFNKIENTLIKLSYDEKFVEEKLEVEETDSFIKDDFTILQSYKLDEKIVFVYKTASEVGVITYDKTSEVCSRIKWDYDSDVEVHIFESEIVIKIAEEIIMYNVLDNKVEKI